MSYEIRVPSLDLSFTLPPSKSVLHRQLIIQFLQLTVKAKEAGKELKDKAFCQDFKQIIEPLQSDNEDIRATRACLKALYEASEGEVFMPCNESGSTLRFMISVGAAFLNYMGLALKSRLVFLPKGRLIERPLDQLVDCLSERGVNVEIKKAEGQILVEGQLKPGRFEIEGNISSQYISGLVMALLLLPAFEVKLSGPLESKGYFDLTLSALKGFGFLIKNEGNVFSIARNLDKNQSEKNENRGNSFVEGDWSSAAFLMTLAALTPGARLELAGLNKDSFQKDKIILEILKKLAFEYDWRAEKLCLVKGRGLGETDNFCLPYLELDAADYPDIVPYIAVAAAARCKQTLIKNIERLHFKECDRVMATIKALKAAGVTAFEKEGSLLIQGFHNESFDGEAWKAPEGIFLPVFGDHRMAMTACLIAAWTGRPVLIDNKECVNKSFPGLFTVIGSDAAIHK